MAWMLMAALLSTAYIWWASLEWSTKRLIRDNWWTILFVAALVGVSYEVLADALSAPH